MKTDLGRILLKLARNFISSELDLNSLCENDKSELLKTYPELDEKKATFVTITKKSDKAIKDLRGCIGSLSPVRSLYDDIAHNAKAAAFMDPRFPSLQKNELDEVIIEVSILTVPEKLNYTNAHELKTIIIPGKHGVIIKKSFNRAVFLPDVWLKLPDFDIFFSHLCKKAGLQANCLQSLDEIYIFYVEKYSEDEISN